MRLQREQLEALIADLKGKQGASHRPKVSVARKKPATGGRPVRDLVIDALDEVGVPTYAAQLSIYIKARFGRAIASSRFGPLSRDEQAAFKGGRPRAVWLCHSLQFEHLDAVRRLWARSDWPLETRIIGPLTGRVLFLQQAARFATLAAEHESSSVEPDRLKFLAADLARDLGVRVKHGSFELDSWRAAAEEQLGDLEKRDLEFRQEVATRIAGKNPEHLLFGSPGGLVVVDGGKSGLRG